MISNLPKKTFEVVLLNLRALLTIMQVSLFDHSLGLQRLKDTNDDHMRHRLTQQSMLSSLGLYP